MAIWINLFFLNLKLFMIYFEVIFLDKGYQYILTGRWDLKYRFCFKFSMVIFLHSIVLFSQISL